MRVTVKCAEINDKIENDFYIESENEIYKESDDENYDESDVADGNCNLMQGPCLTLR